VAKNILGGKTCLHYIFKMNCIKIFVGMTKSVGNNKLGALPPNARSHGFGPEYFDTLLNRNLSNDHYRIDSLSNVI